MDAFLGLDGGGTGTRAALWDPASGQRAYGESGPSNLISVGEANALAHVFEAIARAKAQWSGGAPQIRAVHAGIAGAGQPGVSQFWQNALRQHLGKATATVEVSHDLLTACAGAHGGEPGIVVIAGTGSAAFRRAADGQEFRCGGWGHRLDDAGSGYWLALEGLRRALRGLDGRGSPTLLAEAACAHFKLQSCAELPHCLATLRTEKETVAAFAPSVIELGKTDPVARELCDDAVTEWLALARALIRPGDEIAAVPVALIGGLSRADSLASLFRHRLQASPTPLFWRAALGTPIEGALFLAAKNT